MAKSGFGKFLAICTVAAATAAGVYYYLNKKDDGFADDFDDDFDDFDDFEEDERADARNYVDLERDASLDKDGADPVSAETGGSAETDGADSRAEGPETDDTFQVEKSV